jgi:NAD-dependent dihydropyrimidine dehydrogenase PreA subunit/ferredoxin
MSTPANDPGIAFELDDELVAAQPGETIWSAARRHGVLIPHLCHSDGLRPDGNCRACVVEIEGERTLAPSCCRTPAPGQKVRAQSPRARKSQDLVLELLLADLPAQGHKWNGDDAALPHGELSAWAARQGVTPRASLTALRREPPAADLSHPAMAVNLDACIQCNRCQRACREAQGNDVIGLAFRGAHTQVVFDLADPMGASSCVACGECVQACPTGALMPKSLIGSQKVDRSVDSVCPFCGIGCQITYKVRDEKIVAVDGRPGPANEGRLCVKGRFGFDYAHHPARLTKPLIRKAGVAKDPDHLHARPALERSLPRSHLGRSALDLAAGKLKALRDSIRQEIPRRIRLRQGQQRRGLPVPEAGAHRLRQQQRGPLHPPVPCLQRGRAARRRRLGRREQPGARCGALPTSSSSLAPTPRPTTRWERPGSRTPSPVARSWCWPTRAAPTSPATPGACCSSAPTPTWPCSTRCCTSS